MTAASGISDFKRFQASDREYLHCRPARDHDHRQCSGSGTLIGGISVAGNGSDYHEVYLRLAIRVDRGTDSDVRTTDFISHRVM